MSKKFNPFDILFGPALGKQHVFVDRERATPVNYKGMPVASYGSGDQRNPEQYITLLSNGGASNQPIKEYSFNGSASSAVVLGILVAPVGNDAGEARSATLSRAYDWCSCFQDASFLTGNNGVGIQFFLGTQAVTGILPVGRTWYAEDVPGPGQIRRSVEMWPPTKYRVHFDSVRVVASVNGGPGNFLCMVGRGDTDAAIFPID